VSHVKVYKLHRTYMIRVRSDSVSTAAATWSVIPIGGASCGVPTSVLAGYDSMNEYIEETQLGRGNDNFCYHVRSTVDMPRTNFTFASSNPTSQTTYCKYTTNDQQFRWNIHNGPGLDSGSYGIAGTKGLDLFTVVGNSEIEQAKEDGLINFWPRIKSGSLSLNALYELKDFKRIPELLRRVTTITRTYPNWVRALKDLNKRYRKNARKLVLRELFKLGSSAYLTNEFGLKPALADLTSILDGVISYKEQLRKLLEEQGKRRTLYFSRPLTTLFPESDDNVLIPVVGGYYNGNRFYRKVERIEEPVFHCSMEFSYQMPNLALEALETRALLDAVGLNWNPQIIWNAIPWSFVVDWLVGVNRWLGNTRMNNIEPEVIIYRYNWSVKASRRIICKTKYAEGGPFSPTVTNRTSEEYHYYRDTRMPDWAAYIKTSGLNLKEFSYIGALIGARK